MDTLDFLRRVLPSDGIYASAILIESAVPTEKATFRHRFTSSVEELAKNIEWLHKRGNNTFYAISTFKSKRRNQESAHLTKVIPLDIDCGEGKSYPTQVDALKALLVFLKATKMPIPTIVSSGNGLHIYWILDRALEPNQWTPLAKGVKQLAISNGLLIDQRVTGDSARVLRPINTTNPKGGKPVVMLLERPDVTVEVIQSKLDGVLSQDFITGRTPQQNSLLDALSVQPDYQPANAMAIQTKCKQIEWAISHQDEVNEPLWYLVLGVAGYCKEPEQTAVEWSQDHPEFDQAKTLRKMYQWLEAATGPALCESFKKERPRGCADCVVKGRIGSPTRLGAQYKEASLSQTAPDQTAAKIDMPKPFKRTARGIYITVSDSDIEVCPFDIYPVGYGRDETLGYETVRFHWFRLHAGWQELRLRQAYIAPGNKEFTNAIADQGIVLRSQEQTEYFRLMLRSYMESLKQQRAMTNLYSSMGWKNDNKEFVIGDTVFQYDKHGNIVANQTTLSATTSRIGNELFTTSGDPAQWTQFTSLLSQAKLPWHQFALGVGFSAPLYAFTGLKGLTISLYGPTGGGKTLIQYWIQSIWGNPDKLHFASKFTQNSLFNRMGTYCNLPLTVDEVTLMADKDVSDFIYWVSQGRDKARLTRTVEERDAKEWAMPVVVSTNRSLSSKLIASGLDNEAQAMRLLELTVPSHNMFTKRSNAGREIYKFLMSNYGHVGRHFITYLMRMGEEGIRAAIAEATEKFPGKYGVHFAGEERYWEQAIVLTDLALELAYDWDLVSYHPREAVEWMLGQLGLLRKSVEETKTDAFDVLANFLNDNAAVAVTVMHTGSTKPLFDTSRLPRGDIRVRFDVYRNGPNDGFDRGTLLIDRTFLRKWLSSQGLDYKRFMQEIQDDGADATPRSKKGYLGKDTPVKLAQTYVVGINLSHPRLQGVLDDAEETVDDLMFGQLRAV